MSDDGYKQLFGHLAGGSKRRRQASLRASPGSASDVFACRCGWRGTRDQLHSQNGVGNCPRCWSAGYMILPKLVPPLVPVTAEEYEEAAGEMREVIDNLALLLRRASRKLDPRDPLRTQCVTYLKEIGQAGQPLRAWESKPNGPAQERRTEDTKS